MQINAAIYRSQRKMCLLIGEMIDINLLFQKSKYYNNEITVL